jgi:hypothetical protein
VKVATRKRIASVSLDQGSVFMDADTTNDSAAVR